MVDPVSGLKKVEQPVETMAEVVCVRREGAYLRLPVWCSSTLVLMTQEDYNEVRHSRYKTTDGAACGSLPRPAAGVVYGVRAYIPEPPPQFVSFCLDLVEEIPFGGPSPLPPPGGVPGPGEVLPLDSRAGMRRLIQSTIRETLSKESLDTLAYLVRRAHGLGLLAERK